MGVTETTSCSDISNKEVVEVWGVLTFYMHYTGMIFKMINIIYDFNVIS